MTFANDALHQSNILFRRGADHEESGLRIPVECRESSVSTLESGPSSKLMATLLTSLIAKVMNVVGMWVHIHVLVDSKAANPGACIVTSACRRFHFDGARAIRGASGDAENVSFAFGINVVSGHKLLQRFGSVFVAGLAPDSPQRAIL